MYLYRVVLVVLVRVPVTASTACTTGSTTRQRETRLQKNHDTQHINDAYGVREFEKFLKFLVMGEELPEVQLGQYKCTGIFHKQPNGILQRIVFPHYEPV
jgi:hypothetical protein